MGSSVGVWTSVGTGVADISFGVVGVAAPGSGVGVVSKLLAFSTSWWSFAVMLLTSTKLPSDTGATASAVGVLSRFISVSTMPPINPSATIASAPIISGRHPCRERRLRRTDLLGIFYSFWNPVKQENPALYRCTVKLN